MCIKILKDIIFMNTPLTFLDFLVLRAHTRSWYGLNALELGELQLFCSISVSRKEILQWRHDERYGVSNHQRRDRVGQSREIYSNSVPLSPPHWPYPRRIRPPSWPRVAVASSIQNTKLFTWRTIAAWRTWPGAGAVPKCDWAARSQCGFKQRRADHTKYI